MVYPGFRTCDECEKWIFDEDGNRKEQFPGAGEYVARPAGFPTPCHTCEKVRNYPCQLKTPATGRLADLSDKNRATWALYNRVRGSGISTGIDELAAENLGIIHATIEDYDRRSRRIATSRLEDLLGILGRTFQGRR